MRRILLQNQRHIQPAKQRSATAQAAQRLLQLREMCAIQVQQIGRDTVAALKFCRDPTQITQHRRLPPSV
jgi:hypothetical protein